MARFSSQKGVIVIVAFLTLGIMLLLGSYFLSFSLAESRIAQSQELGNQTYYLAEAGVRQAVWKLKNDEEWRTCFASDSLLYGCECENWSSSFSQDASELLPGGAFEVSLQNSSCGRGQLIATSSVALGLKRSQRVVKATVFKATDLFTDDALLGDGNVETSETNLTVFDGNLSAQGNITFKRDSKVQVYDNQASPKQEGQVLARGNITIDRSALTASSTCSANRCTELCEGWAPGLTSCPPEEIIIPAVDFDSAATTSYKSRASSAQAAGLCQALCNGVACSTKCLYTQGEFDDLLLAVGPGGTLTLQSNALLDLFSVYYVDGNFELRGRRNLVVNGALVLGGNAVIGDIRRWGGGSGNNQLIINDPGPGIPSGLLTKGNVKFGSFASSATTTISGLIYTLGNFELVSVPHLLKIIGGKIVAGNFQLSSVSKGVNIYFDSVIIREGLLWGLGLPGDSPVINLEHWEEVY